jgi:hypothetical protein
MYTHYVAGIIDIVALTRCVFTLEALGRCTSVCMLVASAAQFASMIGPALPQDHFIGPGSRGVCLCACASIAIISLVEGVCCAADT